MSAIIMTNAVAYATPAEDRQGARRKQQVWTRFINNLDWNKLQRKQRIKNNPIEVEKTLLGFGIPVNDTKKGVD